MDNTQVKQDRNTATCFLGLEISRIYFLGFKKQRVYFFGVLTFAETGPHVLANS